MKLGWLIFLGLSGYVFGGYEVKIMELSEVRIHGLCKDKKLMNTKLCADPYDSARVAQHLKIVELIKTEVENSLYISAQLSDSQTQAFVLLNFSKINNDLDSCKFGIKIRQDKMDKNFQEDLIKNLSNGKTLKLLVQTGAMCEVQTSLN